MNRKRLKLYAMAAVIIAYMVQGYLLRVLLFFAPRLRERLVCNSIFIWGAMIRAALGLKVVVTGDRATRRGMLSVSNHPSYLDFFVVPAVSGLCYVSPIDLTAENRFFNLFVKGIGCILVDRKSRDHQAAETAQIRATLSNHLNVHFFPEAKTTDGTEILRFRRPLFAPAVDLDTPVQIITIQYLALDGVPVTQQTKDDIHWYRQNPLNQHFFNFLKYRRIDVRVTVAIRSVKELLATHEHIADAAHAIVDQTFMRYPAA